MKTVMTIREPPELTTPENTRWDWEEVNQRLRPGGFFRTLFTSWEVVTAPEGTPCAVKNMNGEPLYRYKIAGEYAYRLEPEPSCGFPGS